MSERRYKVFGIKNGKPVNCGHNHRSDYAAYHCRGKRVGWEHVHIEDDEGGEWIAFPELTPEWSTMTPKEQQRALRDVMRSF